MGLAIRQPGKMGWSMRRLILGTASVLALGIGGAALDYAADAGNNNAVDAENMPAASEASQTLPSIGGDLWKDDIRWAQLELRNKGFYHGSLDGVVGPETKRAIDQFQRNNGLSRTAVLDAQTFDALTGYPGIGQGSSTSPETKHAQSMTKPAASSNLGN
jgi:peptidoglycan hydrolase-like protein with peptidoglycan-binding domain